MSKTVHFTEARSGLTELLDQIERVHEHVVITRNGRPSAVMLRRTTTYAATIPEDSDQRSLTCFRFTDLEQVSVGVPKEAPNLPVVLHGRC